MNNQIYDIKICGMNISMPIKIYNKMKGFFILELRDKFNKIDIKVNEIDDLYSIDNSLNIFSDLNIEETIGIIVEEIEKRTIEKSDNVILHCSAVKKGNSVIIFCGRRESGKSTALLNMLRKGFDFFSDDFIYLKEGKVQSINLPIKSRLYYEKSLKINIGNEIKYLLPIDLKKNNNNFHNLTIILFPNYNSQSEISVKSINGIDLFNILIENCKKTINMGKIFYELLKILNIPAFQIEYSCTKDFYECLDQIKRRML